MAVGTSARNQNDKHQSLGLKRRPGPKPVCSERESINSSIGTDVEPVLGGNECLEMPQP
jgi:hypothetical protein